jgi:hypothetical protein
MQWHTNYPRPLRYALPRLQQAIKQLFGAMEVKHAEASTI